MMRDGPIPLFAHGMLEYLGGALFIALPIVLSYEDGTAVALSIAFGVAMIAIAASTDGPTSLVNQIPRSAHVALDYVLAVLLIAMPFIAGFSAETAPTVVFIVVGVAHLLITIGTKFRKGEKPARRPTRMRKAP